MGNPTRTIHVVRHAKAGSRTNWSGDDSERPVTEAGVRQSEALAERLAMSTRGPLCSSSFLRCRQTLGPLAERIGVDVEIVDWLAEGSGGHRIFDRLLQLPDGSVLCSHGDVITELLEMFLRRSIPVSPIPSNVRKASTLEISVDDVHVVSVVYVDPPDVDGNQTEREPA